MQKIWIFQGYFNVVLLSSEKRSFYKSLLIWDYHVYVSVEKFVKKLCPLQNGAIEVLYIWQYYLNHIGDITHSHKLGVDKIPTTDYVENLLSQPNNNNNPNNKSNKIVVGLRLSNHWESHSRSNGTHSRSNSTHSRSKSHPKLKTA